MEIRGILSPQVARVELKSQFGWQIRGLNIILLTFILVKSSLDIYVPHGL